MVDPPFTQIAGLYTHTHTHAHTCTHCGQVTTKVSSGYVPKVLEACPKHIHEVMQKCWDHSPGKCRPAAGLFCTIAATVHVCTFAPLKARCLPLWLCTGSNGYS